MPVKTKFERALSVAKAIAEAVGRYGAQAKVNYTQGQLTETVSVLYGALMASVPVAEHELLKKQLQAANARVAKATKGTYISTTEG